MALIVLAGCEEGRNNGEPLANFEADIARGGAPLTVNFSDISDANGFPITSWQWIFGDDTAGTVAEPTHTYTAPGVYSVRLEVDNGRGTDVFLRENYITVDASAVVISEFLASNQSGLRDEDDDSSDWIELFNASGAAVSLEGWSLTDDEAEPRKWVFPAVTLEAGSYLVVFASDKDRRPVNGDNLHTNFKIGQGGEFLGLYSPDLNDGPASSFRPAFPAQLENVTYGLLRDTFTVNFLATVSPGAANASTVYLPPVAPVMASVPRGFYVEPVQVALTSATAESAIYYTTDGTTPGAADGALYTEPITVNTSQVIRAVAVASGYSDGPVSSFTYVFAEDEPEESALPAVALSGEPGEVFFEPNGVMAISGGQYIEDEPDFPYWAPLAEGDYNNPIQRGREFERRVTMEYFEPDNTGDFTVEGGLRFHGSDHSRVRFIRQDIWNLPFSKPSLRLIFRGDYGLPELEAPLFPDTDVDTFDTVIVRAGYNDPFNPFLRDEYLRRCYHAMGYETAHGRFVSLFINGVYRGYFTLVERLDQDFFQRHFESENDWDVILVDEARDGSREGLDALLAYARDTTDDAETVFATIAAQVDVTNFVDYLIVEMWGGNIDWPSNNWILAREQAAGSKFTIHVWDSDQAFLTEYLNVNFFTESPLEELGIPEGLNAHPGEISVLYRALKPSIAFKSLVAARLELLFGTGGALSPTSTAARFNAAAAELAEVVPEMDTSLRDTWIPAREGILRAQFQAEGLIE